MPRLARTSTLVLALTLALAACGGGQVSTVLSTIGEASASIAADDLVFDRDELAVPANVAFGLAFENREAAPHNVSVFTDETASQALYVGEIFGGPASRVYQLPAIAPGSYFFRCDVHTDMKGTLVATP